MPESPLAPEHRQAGATLKEYGPWSLPAFYTSPEEERNSVRNGCGIVDLSNRGQIRFGGEDRQTFLQGMITNDTRMEPGQGRYGAILQPKGQMIADLTLYAFEDGYLADTEPGMGAFIMQTLERYRIREKVEMALETPFTAKIGIGGPLAAEYLRKLLPSLPPIAGPFGCARAEWNGVTVNVLRRDFTGEEGYFLSLPAERGGDLWSALRDLGIPPFGQEALEALRIEAGIPRFGVDMTPSTIPLEASLFYGISRDKGCYTGQEIIERIAARGHTNRRLLPLQFDGTVVPPPGSPLKSGSKEVGTVTSAISSPEGTVGLGYVRNEANAPGHELTVVLPEGETTATVLERPRFGSGQPPAVTRAEPVW